MLSLRLADLIEQNTEGIARLETLDNGKPLAFARDVDVPTPLLPQLPVETACANEINACGSITSAFNIPEHQSCLQIICAIGADL